MVTKFAAKIKVPEGVHYGQVETARGVLEANAAVLKKYPTWIITVEGHCDERGTAEYNTALGERRAAAARAAATAWQPVGGGAATVYKKDIHTITFGSGGSQHLGHKTQVTASSIVYVPMPGASGPVVGLFLLYDPEASACAILTGRSCGLCGDWTERLD